ncbi:MAG: HIT domain-containing protein [Dehalococcoidia bacterium]
MTYVTTADTTPDCFLCATVAENRDRENLILLRGAHAFAILNLYPYNTAHTLVAPYAHISDYGHLAGAIAADMTTMAQRMVRALTAEYTPEGFNIGMNIGRVAGAGLPSHLHTHIVPRWAGDTNFMPVTGDVKVLPETLDRTWERLRGRLDERE